jgi:hypothetical protein
MKTSTVIRFIVAAIFATLACFGLLADIPGIPVLWVVAWLLLMGRSELTKPIPRKELWVGLAIFVVFLGLIATLDILHLHEAQPHGVVRIALATAIWVVWMFAIYYRWRREKVKADA